MKSIETLISLFRQNGLKITPQRRAILELLVNDDSHPTAEEIYRRVLTSLPDVSRTTVYNTLKELLALGELAEVEDLSEGGLRFDTNPGSHHHLFCIGCHTLLDLHHDFPALQLESQESAGYRILKSQVTFYGYCPTCQAQLEGKG
jgi:Fe2+ or Zn2+ uptake regulation protein